MRKLLALLIILISTTFSSNSQILPNPTHIEKKEGFYTLKKEIAIRFNAMSKSAIDEFRYYVIPSSGIKIVKKEQGAVDIEFETIDDDSLGVEGYILEITPEKIIIKASEERGMFYAVHSLLQLLPSKIYAKDLQKDVDWKIQCQLIKDSPKYSFRSFMLDSGRQYQSPLFIKRYLDYMAMLKMNVFHWHLTEGQGWRIEIKKYPKLTSVGSNVAKGKEQQGYYTQKEIKDVVSYAKKKHIVIIPEIDVPGHSEAALTAYPEFTCLKKAPETVMSFTSHIFCGGYEGAYTFLQDVLDEVCELFPGKYVHLGGDEAKKNDWDQCEVCQSKIKEQGLKDSHELQLYFSGRLATYLKKKGKKVIFWGDVVYHDGMALPDNVIVHWWNSRAHKDQALQNAIQRGHEVIAGTNNYSYLNFPLVPWSKYRENRTFDMKTMYSRNPSDLENPNELVLGMSTSLWTDWYVQEHLVDRRVFPRIYAVSEQMWSTADRKPFDVFYEQVKQKYKLLEILGIDYGPAMGEEITPDFSWD